MKNRKILYGVIIAICIISVLIGLYYQIFKTNDNANSNNNINTNINNGNNNKEKQDPEELKNEFDLLFDNDFDNQGYELTNITKIKNCEQYDVVDLISKLQIEEEGKYSFDINIPLFNVQGEIPNEYNQTTKKFFTDKAVQIMNSNKEEYSIFNVDFTACLNENILSVMIRSTLKEGDNPQRLIVQTYNYNIETGEKVKLNDILKEQEIDTKEVNIKIKNIVEQANKNAQALSNAISQKIYQRDINNEMYITDNVNYFYVGPYGQIYIIYPYGNANYTSEIDIIKL